jgi:23S rRNA (cytosine1962-C5)-methyltransferase
LVDLGEQHGCGLYLDQRENRRWVMDTIQRAPRPPAVLNLFAYTCSFSAAAASAGAARVTSVDIAKRPLAWGRDTFALNGLDPAAHAFYPDDVHGVLARSLRRGASFDVIICDPPSFGHGRRAASLHQALSDLAAACAQVLAPRGWLLLCLNHRATAPADFRARALHGIQRAARDVLSADLLLPPPDAPPGGTALKTLRVQVA